MFPSPVTSTPFSVKDILNLEQQQQQQQGGLGSMELAPSCMLATFKQEVFGAEPPPGLPDLREELPEPPPAKTAFPGSYYVKSYVEMDSAKEAKADKKGKGEGWCGGEKGRKGGQGDGETFWGFGWGVSRAVGSRGQSGAASSPPPGPCGDEPTVGRVPLSPGHRDPRGGPGL